MAYSPGRQLKQPESRNNKGLGSSKPIGRLRAENGLETEGLQPRPPRITQGTGLRTRLPWDLHRVAAFSRRVSIALRKGAVGVLRSGVKAGPMAACCRDRLARISLAFMARAHGDGWARCEEAYAGH